MAKKMDAADQVSEICQEIRSAVESYWVFTGISEYVDNPQNLKAKDRFWAIYIVLVNNAFDCMIVSVFNLLDRSSRGLTLASIAASLESEGADGSVVRQLRQVYAHHEVLWKAICHVRNNGVAHLNDKRSTSSNLSLAMLGTKEIRSFLQDAILIFDALEGYCSWKVSPPSRAVESQAAQIFHLASSMSDQLISESTEDAVEKVNKGAR
ncbi:AbiU2 domain-containing protein [Stenotrophomonas maltophilia]|uniref:AbiU2 domain-containing protein n=1 Tax=Stenotrophomonas maltophilia TaxID=40324 RepID=UPI0034DB7C91